LIIIKIFTTKNIFLV